MYSLSTLYLLFVKDIQTSWKVAKFVEFEPAATAVYKSMERHSWYLNAPVVIFALANSDGSVSDHTKRAIAKKLLKMPRDGAYNYEKSNCSGFLPGLTDMQNLDSPPCLSEFVTHESWLVFDYLEQAESQVKWLRYPVSVWNLDKDYKIFQNFVKKTSVVNDASERCVKLIQETVEQAKSEDKLQKMLVVKSKIQRPKNRTKAAFKEAAEQLTPAQQIDLMFSVDKKANDWDWESSELDSSMELANEEEVKAALLMENDDCNIQDG